MSGDRRLVVVGGPGSGKSTLAAALAARLGCPHVELDALWWQSGWVPSPPDEFVRQVEQEVSGRQWVLDGNYFDEIAHIVWPAADAVIWLDPPPYRAVARAVVRTAGRLTNRKVLWNGNRESWHNLTPTSIRRLVRNWPSYSARARRLTEELSPGRTIHLRTKREIQALLAGIRDGATVTTEP
jgi:adenylate kinase family enzyme